MVAQEVQLPREESFCDKEQLSPRMVKVALFCAFHSMLSVNLYPRLSPQFQRLNWPTCNVMKGRRREKLPEVSSQQTGGRRLWYVRKYLRSFKLLVKEEGLHHL